MKRPRHRHAREANAHFLGATKIDDVDYNVIGFSMTVGPAISLYFEKGTNFLRRSERVFPGFGLVEYRFDDEEDFRDYWTTIFRPNFYSRWIPHVRKARVEELAPECVVVEFDLLLSKLSPLLLLKITREERISMRKYLVRVGDTWKLFNSELMGHEEFEGRFACA